MARVGHERHCRLHDRVRPPRCRTAKNKIPILSPTLYHTRANSFHRFSVSIGVYVTRVNPIFFVCVLFVSPWNNPSIGRLYRGRAALHTTAVQPNPQYDFHGLVSTAREGVWGLAKRCVYHLFYQRRAAFTMNIFTAFVKVYEYKKNRTRNKRSKIKYIHQSKTYIRVEFENERRLK